MLLLYYLRDAGEDLQMEAINIQLDMTLEFSVKSVLGLDIYPIYVLCNKTFLGEMQHT